MKSARCVPRDLRTISPWPLERTSNEAIILVKHLDWRLSVSFVNIIIVIIIIVVVVVVVVAVVIIIIIIVVVVVVVIIIIITMNVIIVMMMMMIFFPVLCPHMHTLSVRLNSIPTC